MPSYSKQNILTNIFSGVTVMFYTVNLLIVGSLLNSGGGNEITKLGATVPILCPI